MNDDGKTQQQLIKELAEVRQRVIQLEKTEASLKQSNATHRESEEIFHLLVDQMTDSMIIIDWDGTIRFANETALTLVEVDSHTEVLGRNIVEFMDSDTLPVMMDALTMAKAGHKVVRKEGKVITAESQEKWVEARGTKVHFQGSDCYMVNIRDITERKKTEEALNQAEKNYHNSLDGSILGVRIVSADGVTLYANQATLDLFGFSSLDELKATPVTNHYTPESLAENHLRMEQRKRGESGPFNYEISIETKDGKVRHVEVFRKEIIWDGAGHFQVLYHDITERKRAEEALKESEDRYRILVENASDIVYRTDNTGHFTFVNAAALLITGYQEKELIGRHYPTLIRPDMRDEAMKFFGRQFVKKISNTYSEYPIIVKDGREIWFGQNTQLILQDGKAVAFQSVARDITERKRAEEALMESEKRYRELSILDDLTQLYNSRHFYNQLRMEIDRASRYRQPLTLLLLDIDNFKLFNDAYGHLEGDQVLSRLGQVLKKQLRQSDSAYRYGGEEFIILLPMTTSKDAAVAAERIRTDFKEENFSPITGKDVHMTVSIGMGQYQSQEDMKTFVARVDQLMYQAKKNGKDRVSSES